MVKITIELSGLIGLVPDKANKEVVALALNQEYHTPWARFPSGITHVDLPLRDLDVQLRDGNEPAKPPADPLSFSAVARMGWFKNSSSQSYGIVDESLIKKVLQNRDEVASRIRLVADTVKNIVQDPEWDFLALSNNSPSGVQKQKLADKIEFGVDLTAPKLRVLDKDANFLKDYPLTDGAVVEIRNEPSAAFWCKQVCPGKRLKHFAGFYQLCKHTVNTKKWVPACLGYDLCAECSLSSPGNRPVRCPGAAFSDVDLSLSPW